jgi:PAS domain S-box-containing protein
MKVRKKRISPPREAPAAVQKPVSLENFVDIAYDAIVCLDAERRIIFWNPAAERVYGWTAADVLGKTQAEVAALRPASQQASLEPEERQTPILREDGTLQAEQKLSRKDGSLLWVEYTARTILAPDGTISGYVTTSRDITERKQAQQALTEYARQQEALYQFTDQLHRANSFDDIFSAALDGIINALGCDRASILLFDEAGVMRFVSWRGLSNDYRRITDGHSPWKQDEKFPIPICVSDVPSADFSDELKATIQKEGISSLAFIPLDTSRKLIGKFMVYYNKPHSFTTSEVELCLTLARQMAFGVDRIHAEEKLRTSEALYRAVVRSIPGGGVYVVNRDMRYVVAEGEVTESFGLSREMLEGHTVSEVFDEEIAERMHARFKRNFAGETISYEVTRGENVYWIQQAPLVDASGQALVVSMDITRQRQAEKRTELLAHVGELVREITDPEEFLYKVSRIVGDHLQVQRTMFVEIDRATDRGFVRRDYCRDVPSVTGEYRLSEYSDQTEQEMQAGFTVVNGDSKMDPRTAAYYEQTYAVYGERAYVAVPLLRDGKWVATFWVSANTPREWAEEDIALLETIAERAWLATEKMRLDKALRQSEERFVLFMQHLPGLAWIKDLQGRYIYANDAAEKAFNVTGEDLYGRTDQDIFPAETAAQFRQNDQLALREHRGIQFVETLKQEDDVLHYSLVSKFPIPGPDGKPVLIGGTAFDITERKQAEEALRASEERLRTLANAAPSIVWTASPDGVITYSNEHWYKYTGISPEDNARNWAEMVLHPDDYERCVREWTKALETQPDEYLIEVRNRRYDGVYRWFQTRAIPMRDERGQVTSWYGVTTDIHDRIETENALRENQEELKVLNENLEQRVQERTEEVRKLASELTKAEQRERHRIAHILHDDLQQRLYAIKMHTGLLGNKLDKHDAKLMYDLADVKEQLDDVIVVTRQLSVDISPPILKDEGLAHAIGWLASQMKEQHGLHVELLADGPYILPDEDIQVLLFNSVRELLFNVVKHAGVDRAVVALERSNVHLRIEVRDQGRGFAQRTQGMPQNGDEGEYRKPSFGLPTLRHRIGLFGGHMNVDSTPGSGTQIILTIPVYSEGGALRQ